MDIVIRGLDAQTVFKLKDHARNSQLSREAYLREHLTDFAFIDDRQTIEDRYAELTEKTVGELKSMEGEITALRQSVDRLVEQLLKM